MKFIKFLFIIFISLPATIKADSNKNLVNELKEGGKLIFIRHAYAPGVGDPDSFNIQDCGTQRNLNYNGKEQAKEIGEFFRTNQIKIDKILSSEWCRCKDTAKLAFKNYETFDALNSFYDVRFMNNKDKQIKDLRNYINNWKSKKNLILVTHYVVILEILNKSTLPGEIIVSDKGFNIIGNFNVSN